MVVDAGLFCAAGDPRRPPRAGPIPRSRRRILAAALALPLSRFFSAKGAGCGGGTGAGDDVCDLFRVAACLLRTLTASRAAFSTLIAWALLLSGLNTVVLAGFAGDFLSEPEAAFVSFASCRACFTAFVAAAAFSLPLFAFLSLRYWINGVVVILSLLLLEISVS